MPSHPVRLAIYYSPDPESLLGRMGAEWLGRDAALGAPVTRPDLPVLADLGLPAAQITVSAARYGLHGTLKPPFRLAEGVAGASFLDAVEDLADGLAPVTIGPLRVAALGPFIALVPQVQPPALDAAAAEVVRALDPFRAPPSEAELARRRNAGLSARQEALLAEWGYPYVMEEFRFHVTLTDALPADAVAPLTQALAGHFAPALTEPACLDALVVFGEAEDGLFHEIRRFPLRG